MGPMTLPFPLVAFCFVVAASACIISNPAPLPDLERRARNYIAANGEPLVQDNNLRETWYSVGDWAMPTNQTMPNIATCGTYNPIWMEGTNPNEADGEVVRFACTMGFFSNCSKRVDIKVIKCNGFLFYYLKPTALNTAYCFDPKNLQIPGINIAPPPQFRPRSASIECELKWKDLSSMRAKLPYLIFSCNFDTSTDKDYWYSVMWYIDDTFFMTIGPKPGSNIADTALTEEHLIKEGIKTLGITLKCGVRVREGEHGIMGNVTHSSAFFAGIKVLTPTLKIERGREAVISVHPTVPVGCASVEVRKPNCILGLHMIDNDTNYDCSGVAVPGNVCGVEILGDGYTDAMNQTNNWNRTFTFKVTTIDTQFYDMNRNIFQIALVTDENANEHKIWQSYRLPEVQIEVLDSSSWKRKTCSANVDPHMQTADGRLYENQNNGEFILYKHKSLPLAVQMKTMPCNNNMATCACAVTIRAGGDLYGFILCDGQKTLVNYLSCKDGIMNVVQETEYEYKVILPTGTRVDIIINRGPTYRNTMNVAIQLSKKDDDRIEGLCGSFNGDQNDDFVMRNTGAIIQDNNQFSLSWKMLNNYTAQPRAKPRTEVVLIEEENSMLLLLANVSGKQYTEVTFQVAAQRIDNSESFLNTSNQDPESWDNGKRLCICSNSTITRTQNLRTISVCSPDESVLCTHKKKPNSTKDVVKCPFFDNSSSIRSRRDLRTQEFTDRSSPAGNIRRRKSSISLERAIASCDSFFALSPNYKLQNDLPVNTLNNSIYECALDYQMSDGDISWAVPHLQSWTSNIKTQISRDKSFQENHADVTETFLANACPNQCNSHGRCTNGTCVCNHGFGSGDCSIDLTVPPSVSDIYNDGQCDTSIDNCCSGFSIYGDDFIRSESLECEVEKNEIDMMGTILSRDLVVAKAEFVSLFEVICPVSCNSPSTSTKSPMVTVYNLSVSNFGQNFGKRQAMAVIDQRCTLMKPNNSFSLKPGHCYISGVCYADGENNPTVNCQACASAVNPYDWSSKWSMECTENGACSNGPPVFFYALAWLVTVLVQLV